MSAKQHIRCAANCDQHHPCDADGFMMYPPLEADAGTKETCRHEPH